MPLRTTQRSSILATLFAFGAGYLLHHVTPEAGGVAAAASTEAVSVETSVTPNPCGPPSDDAQRSGASLWQRLAPPTGSQGPAPGMLSRVTLRGWRPDGTVLTEMNNARFPYELSARIPLARAVKFAQQMRVGEKRRLWVPASTLEGAPSAWPKDEWLCFDLQLLEVMQPQASRRTAAR